MADSTLRKLPLKKPYAFRRSKGIEREIEEIIAMEIRWPGGRGPSVRRGYIVELFEAHDLTDAFISLHWPSGRTPERRWYRNHVVRLEERFEAGGDT